MAQDLSHLSGLCLGRWGGKPFAFHCLFSPESGPELYGRNMAMIYVDNYIIMPAAIGCMVTGLIYAQLTNWGFLKFFTGS